ncbi:hypothetical protein WAE58_05980 [Pedobacter panaciterrae]|jgi:hypothetical protein|uniref:Uncharacterized protein n=1 Tax=Pedobacter panaciterrae TaxID=363849 RepID=A0ABU8NI84_9SPHI
MVADIPDQKIILKAFHGKIQNDFDALNKEEKAYVPIPVIRTVNSSMVQKNYLQIKQEVQDIVRSEVQRMMGDPALAHLVIRKN